jgi:hypothetical protein
MEIFLLGCKYLPRLYFELVEDPLEGGKQFFFCHDEGLPEL